MKIRPANAIGMFLLSCSVSVMAMAHYVDPNGLGGAPSDANPGTISQPWLTATKGFSGALPGDTVYFRAGVYRLGDKVIGIDAKISKLATATSRICFAGYPDETAVIKGMILKNNPQEWQVVPGYPNIYSLDFTTRWPANLVSQVSQDSLPLRAMPERFDTAGPQALNAPGQWCRRRVSANLDRIYVWSRDNANPGNRYTEIQEFDYTIYIDHDGAGQPNYLTFENLTLEGGYYPIAVGTDNIQMKSCKFRNFDGHVKVLGNVLGGSVWSSVNGLIENCEIYNYLGLGIDITGGDYWTVRGCNIHNGGYALMAKNNSIGVLFERNMIHDIDNSDLSGQYDYAGSFANTGIYIGGSSFGGIDSEAVDCVVRNNIFYNLKGAMAVNFMCAVNCSLYNNLIYECDFTDAAIVFSYNNPSHAGENTRNPVVKNNIFAGNAIASNRIYGEATNGALVNLVSGHNLFDIPPTANMTGVAYDALADLQAGGYETGSIIAAPLFVNASAWDFRPASGSPVIDHGENIPGDLYDFNGHPRLVGSFVDIGPYEFDPSSSVKRSPADHIWPVSASMTPAGIKFGAAAGSRIMVFDILGRRTFDFQVRNGNSTALWAIKRNAATSLFYVITDRHGQKQSGRLVLIK